MGIVTCITTRDPRLFQGLWQVIDGLFIRS